MNRNLLNAVALSFALHASSVSIATHGKLPGFLIPMKELQRMQEAQSAVSFTFVESPSTQLRDEEPAQKSNLISDKSTLAKDTHQGSGKGMPDAPHVDHVGQAKQVGRLAGMAEPPTRVPEKEPASKPQALKKSQSIMKAQKVDEDSPGDQPQEAQPREEIQVKKAYRDRIKELQEKIDRAQEQIKQNEKILREHQLAGRQKKELLQEEQEKQAAEPRRGMVGLGGACLHGTDSDLQGDVDRFGEFAFNASRYELGDYFRKLKTTVEEYWLPYLTFTYSGGNLFGNKTVIFFKIMPNGNIRDVKLLEHSGDDLLKEFCLSSVQDTSPFGPLPETFLKNSGYHYLPIVFTFHY